MERDRVMKERQKRLMAKRILQRDVLKKMNSKEKQIWTREQKKRLKSKVMQKRSVVAHLRNEKRIMMEKKAIERYNYDPKYRFLQSYLRPTLST
jgi:hypothetical protein